MTTTTPYHGYPPQYVMPNVGWKCPSCSRCFAPNVSMCIYCPPIYSPSYPYITSTAPGIANCEITYTGVVSLMETNPHVP